MNFLFSLLIIFFELIINIFCQLPIWNLENSSINLLSLSNPYNYTMYDETKNGDRIKLEKYIEKKNGEKPDYKNYIQKNDDEKEAKFDDIYKVLILDNKKKYICPKGKNYLFEYSSNKLKEIKHSENEITDNWFFNCGIYKNRIIISYLGSNDIYIYALNLETNNWENYKFGIRDQWNWWQVNEFAYYRYYDIIFPSENKDLGISVLLNDEGILLAKITFVFNNNYNNIIIEDKKTLMNYYDLKSNSSAFFDKDKYLYWITYDNNKLLSGYSYGNIQDDIENMDLNNFGVHINYKSPFESFELNEDFKIKNITFIRNTKYIYYQIQLNSVNYYGVIDIRENKIFFNTNETIMEFRPISKYSLLAITQSSAYEICINGKFNGKCRDKCPNNNRVKINNEKGNFCEDNNCPIVLIPYYNCIEKCDEPNYVLNGKECGLCKYLNKTFPYKIINETNCLKEKPKNTYLENESTYILKYCHYSCETCSLEGEYHCHTCKKSFYKNYEGKCDTKCPDNYFKNDKNRTCSKCDNDCKTCDNEKVNNNSHCLTCKDPQKYVVLAKGFDHNCVYECPKNTKTNIKTRECLSENDDDNDNNNSNHNGLWILILIISISLIIVMVIIIIVIFKKCCKKKNEEDVNLVLKSQDDFAVTQNESISQDWSVY